MQFAMKASLPRTAPERNRGLLQLLKTVIFDLPWCG